MPAGPTAKDVVLAEGATIAADATKKGDGGRVAVLSVDETADAATITARGGVMSGNGGRVEISSLGGLTLGGPINAAAPRGTAGTILVDPYDLTIAAAAKDGADDADITADTSAGEPNLAYDDPDDKTNATITPDAIEALTGSVWLQASHDLTIDAGITLNAAGESLRLEAGHDLAIAPQATISTAGEITLVAASPTIPDHDSAGAITIVGGVTTTAGTLTLQAGSDGIAIGGALDAPAVTLTSAGGPIIEPGGSVQAGTLSGSAASADLSGDNAIATLGAFAAPGGFTLDDAQNLTLAGSLGGDGASVHLDDPGFTVIESGGSITAGTLSGSATSVNLSGNNAIATLGAFAAPGGFTLDDAQNLTLAGSLGGGGASVHLDDPGFAVIESGGGITAGTLSGRAASVNLSGNNAIATLGAFAAPGGFTLDDAQNLTLAGSLGGDGASVHLDDPGFTVIESGGSITAGTLSGSATSVGLGGANTIVALGDFTAPGGFTLATAGGFTVGGVLDAGDASVRLRSGGSIAEDGGGSIRAGELEGFAGGGTLDGSAGNASFGNTNTIAELGDFTAPGGFTLDDAAPLALDGALDADNAGARLLSGGALSESGGSIRAAELGGTVASAVLDGANTIAALGGFSAPGGISLRDTRNLSLDGQVNAGSAARFVVEGSLAESGNGVLGAGTFAADASSIALTNSANRIANLGAIASPGGLVLATGTDLAISGSIAAAPGAVTLRSGGRIAEDGDGTVIAGELSGSAAGGADFGNPNTVAELGDFSAPGGFTLDAAGDLALAGALDAGGALVDLHAGGGLSEVGAGVIAAGTLTGSAEAVALDGPNRIGTLGYFDAGAFGLGNVQSLAVAGTVTGDSIALAVAGDLTLGAGGNAGALESAGAVDLAASGAITEVNGAIDAASLTGNAASANLGGANRIGTLGAFASEGPFRLTDGAPDLLVGGPVSAGVASLTTAGSLTLRGTLAAASVVLSAAGRITQPSGAIAAGVLDGSASEARLTGANAVGTLGAFAAPGGLFLTDTKALEVAGPIDANLFSVADSGTVAFGGPVATGTLELAVGGSVTEPSGSVAATLLEGEVGNLAQFGPDAPAGVATIGTLGPFRVGTLALADAEPLAIAGPLEADYFAISAPSLLVLDGGAELTTEGLAVREQSGPAPVRPGSYFAVTTAGGRFATLGTTTINSGGGAATIRIEMPEAGGTVHFANLIAPSPTLILATGSATISGTLAIGGLVVLGTGGRAVLRGSIDSFAGVLASSKAKISPFQSARYRFNSCPLMSIDCIFIRPEQVPQGNPLANLFMISVLPAEQDFGLILPNVAYRDY